MPFHAMARFPLATLVVMSIAAVAQPGAKQKQTVGEPGSNPAYLLNGISPSDLFGAQQGRYSAIEAFTAGIRVPATARQHQANGLASYVESRRRRPIGNGGDVAGYFQALSAADAGNVFGINVLVADTPGLRDQALQNEFDINVNSASTSAVGLGVVLNSTVSSGATGFMCRIASTARWNNCYQTDDGASAIGMSLGTATTGNNAFSQYLRLNSRSGGGEAYSAALLADPAGSLLLRSGRRNGAVAFQTSEGSNNAYVNGEGLRVVTATPSSSPETGAIVSSGGIGVKGEGHFGGALTAAAFSGVGTATIVALSSAGAGASARCGQGHRCDGFSGTIEFSAGKGAQAGGDIVAVIFPQPLSGAVNCIVQGWAAAAAAPRVVGVSAATAAGFKIGAVGVATAADQYSITYLCGGS
jgi:hypothetical protein